MGDLYTRFDNVFFERTRLSILTLVARSERASFNLLRDTLNATEGALYTHVEKLVQGGYLAKQREIANGSPQTVYTLTPEGRAAYADYLQFLEKVITDNKQLEGGRDE
jgi:DNA-binding MarR family transcriptional regulator